MLLCLTYCIGFGQRQKYVKDSLAVQKESIVRLENEKTELLRKIDIIQKELDSIKQQPQMVETDCNDCINEYFNSSDFFTDTTYKEKYIIKTNIAQAIEVISKVKEMEKDEKKYQKQLSQSVIKISDIITVIQKYDYMLSEEQKEYFENNIYKEYDRIADKY